MSLDEQMNDFYYCHVAPLPQENKVSSKSTDPGNIHSVKSPLSRNKYLLNAYKVLDSIFERHTGTMASKSLITRLGSILIKGCPDPHNTKLVQFNSSKEKKKKKKERKIGCGIKNRKQSLVRGHGPENWNPGTGATSLSHLGFSICLSCMWPKLVARVHTTWWTKREKVPNSKR